MGLYSLDDFVFHMTKHGSHRLWICVGFHSLLITYALLCPVYCTGVLFFLVCLFNFLYLYRDIKHDIKAFLDVTPCVTIGIFSFMYKALMKTFSTSVVYNLGG